MSGLIYIFVYMEEVLHIEDWLYASKKKQFRFIGTNERTAIRLNDGIIFGINHRVSIGKSSDLMPIVGFDKNCIDVGILDLNINVVKVNINDLEWFGIDGRGIAHK